MNCFPQYTQSFNCFQYMPISFGNCGPMGQSQMPQTCQPMGGFEAQFWSQLMQVQQSMFQGWQQFCGCQQQQFPQPQFGGCQPQFPQQPQFGGCQPQFPQQPQFGGCQPPEVNIHHHYHYHQAAPAPAPAPAPQRPAPQAIPPRPPLTRTPPLPAPTPRITTRPLPSVPAAATPNNRTVHVAHSFGAFGNGTFVGNASMHNNAMGGQALTLRSNTTVSAQVSHQTSVSVTGFRV